MQGNTDIDNHNGARTINNSELVEIRNLPGNNCCCDCLAHESDWACAVFGVLLCLECAGKHRALGVNISFIRSLYMDTWTHQQRLILLHGGNGRFRLFLQQLNAVNENLPFLSHYCTTAGTTYRESLKRHVENIIAYHISADDTRYTSTIVACEEDDAASVDGGESSPQFDWLGEESLRKIYNVHFPLGSMGMSLSCLGDSLAVVTAVVPGGYAHSKGVLPMDVVVGVAGKQLTDYHEVTHMILCLTRPLAISFARNRLVGDGSSKNSSRKGSPTPAPPPNPPLLSTPHEGIGIPSSLMLESSSDDEDHDAHSQPTAPVARSPVHEKPPTGARRRDPSATAKKRMSFHKQTPGPLFPTVDSLTQLDSLQHKFPAPEVSATDNTAKSSELSSEEVNVVRGVRGLHDITLAEQVLFAKEEQDARKTESVATETFYPASRSVFERWVAEDGDEITPATTPQVSPKNSSEDSSAPVSKAVPMPVRATATVSSTVPESSPVYSSSSSVGVSSLPVTGERTPLCVKQPSANSWEYEAIFFRKPYGFTITKNYWDCAMVSAVIPGGKASQQQMAVGDTIVAVNRQWTQRYEDVLHHLQRIDRQAESGSGNNTVLFLMKRSMSFMMSSVTASLATESARLWNDAMKVSQDLLKTNVYHHSAARSPAENSSLPSSPGIPSSDRVQGDAQRSVTSSLEAGTASIVIPPSVGSPTSSSSPAA